MTTDVKSNRIVLYACGGAGVQISKTMEEFRNNQVTGFSPLDIVYIDTSSSDFQGISEDHVYRFKDKDGSGALRVENAAVIARYAQEILQEHKPGFLNIVISSGGGGKRFTL